MSEDVPSPTFTLVQVYETPRLTVRHYDLYRIENPAEMDELGLDEALDEGAALIEWPERAEDGCRPICCVSRSRHRARPARSARSDRPGAMGDNISRARMSPEREAAAALLPRQRRLARCDHRAAARRCFDAPLRPREPQRAQGDADGSAAIAETPAAPANATPEERRALGYNAVARLAGADVGRFVAASNYLRRLGLSAPEIYAADPQQGFVLIEDLGDALYADVLMNGADEHGPL